jgi:hypothetical protein
MKRSLGDRETLAAAWEAGKTGIAPALPGHYWIFIQRWRMTEVRRDGDGILRTSYPKNKPVDEINIDRWGRKWR